MPAKTPPHHDFGRRLYRAIKRYELRMGTEMSQKTLAEKLRVSDGTVSAWINGRLLPKVEQLEGISEILDVNPGWLAFGERAATMTPDGEVWTESPSPPEQDGHPAQGKHSRKR